MADFDTAVNITLKHEGGLTKDVGGLTKYGISQKAYPGLDIEHLTLDQAKKIYYRDYWMPLNLDSMAYQPLANQLFDIGVNSGVGGAKKLLKNTLISLNIPMMLSELKASDIQALNKKDGQKINNRLAKLRGEFYSNLAKNEKKYRQYLTGWLSRAVSFMTSEPMVYISEAALALSFFFVAIIILINKKGKGLI